MPTPGARRAGQDREAPEGSLDAPKRSRTISKPERPVSLLGRRSCPDQRVLLLHDRGALTRTKSWLDVDPDRVTIWGPDFHDKPGRAETPTSGRERPRGAGLGSPWRSTSGVLTPRLPLPHRGPGMNGRHKTPPHAGDTKSGKTLRDERLQRWAAGAVSSGRSRIDVIRKVVGESPLLWGCVPLLGPLTARTGWSQATLTRGKRWPYR
jgi:hypothetical protein